MLYLNEIFSSLQGEGINSGIPTTFIRFQGCNLNCFWCDTPQAKKSIKKTHQQYMVTNILDSITRFHNQWICITGGEPFLQNPSELLQLVKTISKKGFQINLQTNGTIFNEKILPYINLWSISLKPNLFTQLAYKKSIKAYLSSLNHANGEFKLVLVKLSDLSLVLSTIITIFPEISQKQIPLIVTPDGRKTEKIMQKLNLLYTAYGKLNNKKYQHLNLYLLPQLHRLLGIH